MLLVFKAGELAGVPSNELLEAARTEGKPNGPIKAYGIFAGAMTTWYPAVMLAPGMEEAAHEVTLGEFVQKR